MKDNISLAIFLLKKRNEILDRINEESDCLTNKNYILSLTDQIANTVLQILDIPYIEYSDEEDSYAQVKNKFMNSEKDEEKTVYEILAYKDEFLKNKIEDKELYQFIERTNVETIKKIMDHYF